jgi:hypothetical protein
MTSCGVAQCERCSEGSQRRQVEVLVALKGWRGWDGVVVMVAEVDGVEDRGLVSPGRE